MLRPSTTPSPCTADSTAKVAESKMSRETLHIDGGQRLV